MKNIVILGGGVLGTQIAFQVAYSDFNVKMWLRSEGSIGRTMPKLKAVKKSYLDAIRHVDKKKPETFCRGLAPDLKKFNKDKCLKKVNEAYDSINITLDLKEALKNADLVIESMTEDFNAKKDLFKTIAPLLPKKTILVTNSSTLLPGKLAKYTGRPEKFLALHFANSIWKNNTAEVMKHKNTDDRSFKAVLKFASEINMIPLPLEKEKSGYLLNSMLVPFLFSGLDLYVNDISDPESIDKAWKLGTGAPKGPFEILDTVGLKTAHEIVKHYTKIPSAVAPYSFKKMEKCLREYIEAGKLGKSSGEGFYKYGKK